jgi:hypothetical protein
MLKQITIAVLGLGLLGAQACSVESSSSEDTLSVGNVGQGMCNSNNGVNPMLADLAVAMAEGIGELHPVRDLEVVGGRVRLSSTGRSNCNAAGGCSNIDALLDLQNDAVNDVVPNTVFNATNYRSTLVASYQRQADTELNLARNDPNSLPEPHSLAFDSVSDNGACNAHYVFNAYKADCSTGCDDLRQWQGGDWQFTVAEGERIQHNGRIYQANQAIGYPNAECAPGAAQAWCSSWFSEVGSCSQCQMDNPQDIEHRLAFFENGSNPFLAFYAKDGQIAIDPTGIMTGDTTVNSGSCSEGSMAYDPTYRLNNKCCQVSGKYGTFKPSSFNKTVFLCALQQ